MTAELSATVPRETTQRITCQLFQERQLCNTFMHRFYSLFQTERPFNIFFKQIMKSATYGVHKSEVLPECTKVNCFVLTAAKMLDILSEW